MIFKLVKEYLYRHSKLKEGTTLWKWLQLQAFKKNVFRTFDRINGGWPTVIFEPSLAKIKQNVKLLFCLYEFSLFYCQLLRGLKTVDSFQN
jgi:hypothetical protein